MAHVSFSDRNLSVVHRLHPCCRRKLHFFNFFLTSIGQGQLKKKLGIEHLWMKKIQVSSNEVPCPFQRGDINKIVKIH